MGGSEDLACLGAHLEAIDRSEGLTDSLPEVSAISLQSRSSVQQGDLDGARRLGRLARLLSITFIILGIVIIIVAVTVNFAGETQLHGGAGLEASPWARAVGVGKGIFTFSVQDSGPGLSSDRLTRDGFSVSSYGWIYCISKRVSTLTALRLGPVSCLVRPQCFLVSRARKKPPV